jgi:hypothetical protein
LASILLGVGLSRIVADLPTVLRMPSKLFFGKCRDLLWEPGTSRSSRILLESQNYKSEKSTGPRFLELK